MPPPDRRLRHQRGKLARGEVPGVDETPRVEVEWEAQVVGKGGTTSSAMNRMAL
jgi:hypothetical protein